jgi:hypothetical protein
VDYPAGLGPSGQEEVQGGEMEEVAAEAEGVLSHDQTSRSTPGLASTLHRRLSVLPYAPSRPVVSALPSLSRLYNLE